MATDQLTVHKETHQGALVVRVAGEVDLATAPALGRELAELEHAVTPAMPLVIDTTDVSFMASAGLALLVDLHQRCSAAGVALRIAAGNRTVMRALTMSGLTDLLTVDENLTAALQGQQS